MKTSSRTSFVLRHTGQACSATHGLAGTGETAGDATSSGAAPTARPTGGASANARSTRTRSAAFRAWTRWRSRALPSEPPKPAGPPSRKPRRHRPAPGEAPGLSPGLVLVIDLVPISAPRQDHVRSPSPLSSVTVLYARRSCPRGGSGVGSARWIHRPEFGPSAARRIEIHPGEWERQVDPTGSESGRSVTGTVTRSEKSAGAHGETGGAS